MPLRTTPRALALLTTAGLLAVPAAAQAAAKPSLRYGTTTPKKGTTLLTLDREIATTFATAPVEITGIAPNPAPTEFKVSGGKLALRKAVKRSGRIVKPRRLTGTIDHAGGMTLTRDKATLRLTRIRLRLTGSGRTGTFEAVIDGRSGSAQLGTLSKVRLNANNTKLTAKVTLTIRGSALLNTRMSLAGLLLPTTALGTVTTTL